MVASAYAAPEVSVYILSMGIRQHHTELRSSRMKSRTAPWCLCRSVVRSLTAMVAFRKACEADRSSYRRGMLFCRRSTTCNKTAISHEHQQASLPHVSSFLERSCAGLRALVTTTVQKYADTGAHSASCMPMRPAAFSACSSRTCLGTVACAMRHVLWCLSTDSLLQQIYQSHTLVRAFTRQDCDLTLLREPPCSWHGHLVKC